MSQTTTTTTVINYGAIVQELSAVINTDRHIETIKAAKIGEKSRLLRDYFTVGITAVRQTGITRWLIEEVANNPTTVLVLINSKTCEVYADLCKKTFPDSEHLCTLKDRIIPWRRVFNQYKASNCHPTPFDKVIVQESRIIFDSLKIGLFYLWVANSNKTSTPTVVLIN